MSLDNALRRELLAAGECIMARTDEGMAGVASRVRSRRNRRAGAFAVALLLIASLAVSKDGGEIIDARPDLPPAREYEDRSIDRDERARLTAVQPVPAGEKPLETARQRRQPQKKRSRVSAPPTAEAESAIRPAEEPTVVAVAPDPRVVGETYRVNNTAGTHMGENAGLGCTEGAGVTGSDDCFHLRVADDETSIDIEVVDDAGVVVSFHINEHYQGASRPLGGFCGSTEGRIPVTPGSLLLVSIDGGADCSDRQPTSGELVARFWR